MKKEIKKIFLEALGKRLVKVSLYLKNYQGKDSAITVKCTGPENEEALRLIMVRYFPKLQKGDIRDDEKTHLFYLIDLIKSSASGSDLRYLDAYNNIFEAVSVRKWDKKDLENYIIPFYRKYKIILEDYLDSD